MLESGGGLLCEDEVDRWRAIWEMRWVDVEEEEDWRAEGKVGESESGGFGGVELADVEIGRAVRAGCGRVTRGL